MIIYKPVKAEFKETWLYKKCFKKDDEFELNMIVEDVDRPNEDLIASYNAPL